MCVCKVGYFECRKSGASVGDLGLIQGQLVSRHIYWIAN